jgi:Arc/MetJ-type ribon-helix-helix transcriptional regulator
MDVQLSPSHQKWLADQVASGVFPSIDAALAWAIEGMMPLADDDLDWARPLLADAETSLLQGKGIEGVEFLARLDRKIESLR